MAPRIPPQLAELATKWLTQRLVENKVFVSAVQNGHRFYQDARDGFMEGMQDKSPTVREQDQPSASAHADRATTRSSYHADREREETSRRARHSDARPAAEEPSSSRAAAEDDASAQLNELLEKMRQGPKR